MIKFLLGLFFIVGLLEADINNDKCDKDSIAITKFYYAATRMYDNKKYEEAIKNFEASNKASFSALETCLDHEYYNDTVIYDYIISSELKIIMIQDTIFEVTN